MHHKYVLKKLSSLTTQVIKSEAAPHVVSEKRHCDDCEWEYEILCVMGYTHT